jgi:hypothetical protein
VCHVWHQHSAAFLFCIKAKRRPSFKNGTSIFKGAFMTNTKQWAIGAASLLMGLAHAQVRVPMPAFTPYTQQCNVCHFAYPPGMLPAASWKKLMDAMPQHFTGQVMMNIDTQEEISNMAASQCQHVRAGGRRAAATPHHPIRLVDQDPHEQPQGISRRLEKTVGQQWRVLRHLPSSCGQWRVQRQDGEGAKMRP